MLGAECHSAVTLQLNVCQHPEGGRFNWCQYRRRGGWVWTIIYFGATTLHYIDANSDRGVVGSGQWEGGGLPSSHGDTAPILSDFSRFNWFQYRQRTMGGWWRCFQPIHSPNSILPLPILNFTNICRLNYLYLYTNTDRGWWVWTLDNGGAVALF